MKYLLHITTIEGFEDILLKEVQKVIDIKNHYKGIGYLEINANFEELVRLNLELFTAIKIFVLIDEFEYKNEKDIYEGAKKFNWIDILSKKQTFMISPSGKGTVNIQFALLKLKDAIVDWFSEKYGSRPDIDKKDPDIKLQIYLSERTCKIYIDTSYTPLYHRGYRTDGHFSPMKENLAAGLVILSGWKGEKTLFDPFCGTGTIPIEAFLLQNNAQPGYSRNKWGYFNMDQNAGRILRSLKRSTEYKKLDICGIDVSKDNIDIARKGLKYLTGKDDMIRFFPKNFFLYNNEVDSGVIVTDPPFGLRTEKEADFEKRIGDKLKKDFKGWDAYIFTGEKETLKNIGLRVKKRFIIKSQPLDARLAYIPLY